MTRSNDRNDNNQDVFTELARAVQPLLSALSTFEADFQEGKQYPYPGLSSSDLGKDYAAFRCLRRLSYVDLRKMHDALRDLGLLDTPWAPPKVASPAPSPDQPPASPPAPKPAIIPGRLPIKPIRKT